MTETHTCNCHKQTKETFTLMILCRWFYSCIEKPVLDVLHNICKRSYSCKDYQEVKENLSVRGIELGTVQSTVSGVTTRLLRLGYYKCGKNYIYYIVCLRGQYYLSFGTIFLKLVKNCVFNELIQFFLENKDNWLDFSVEEIRCQKNVFRSSLFIKYFLFFIKIWSLHFGNYPDIRYCQIT